MHLVLPRSGPARLGTARARVAPDPEVRVEQGKVVGVRTGDERPTVAVLLPGSGSDELFVAAVFERPLAAMGIRLLAPPPRVGADLVHGMRLALDEHAGPGVLVGGVSLGAHVAARWVVRNQGRCAGLLVALPAWVGEPGPAPAALAAAASAAGVRRDGIEGTLRQVRSGAPAWVADELDRAWRRHGAALADSLHAASSTAAPTLEELRGLVAPVGIAALADDPLHPRSVAESWAGALPAAALVTTSMAAVGHDRDALGRAALLGWLRAREIGSAEPLPFRR